MVTYRSFDSSPVRLRTLRDRFQIIIGSTGRGSLIDIMLIV